ncbi:MAG: glucans biosynthesis glucosyltransferase MdoH [Gemmatimonadota bacterium]|nr:glucans biosynthesis glucosyltransferase MdoH [Gemmatimonadota bacterium]
MSAPSQTTPPPVSSASIFDAPGLGLRRTLFAFLVAGTTVYGVSMMASIVGAGGTTLLEVAILVLFAPTFGWISIAFWNAILGFVLQAWNRDPLTLRPMGSRARTLADVPITTRTALVVPSRNEDVSAVVERIRWMLDSLEETGMAGVFDVHLLSDADDPGLIDVEEREWSELREEYGGSSGLHYRRRSSNQGRKAGNIAEFCERCGDDYAYFVVLDADSVMRGDTLVHLVRGMEADPSVGLLQTVPLPRRQETRFGRFVEFASTLYGPMLATGQSFWQGDAANYWGHNAIVRMDPFRRHGRLPVLPGSPPLGGEILSHDFVEAALLRRAGWSAYLLPDVKGSWEDVPSNLLDFARRDRRWAQGSLQHLRLMGLAGLHPLSRLHFLLGAMGYVSSLLWLLLLLASTIYVAEWQGIGGIVVLDSPTPGPGAAGRPVPSLLGITAGLLFIPKMLGVGLAFRDRIPFANRGRLAVRASSEAAFAVLVAPIMMLVHAWCVTSIVAGRSVAWGSQLRDGRIVSWSEATRRVGWVTAVGVAWGAYTLFLSPLFFAWLSPIFAGLLVAVPTVRWTSDPRHGVVASGRDDGRRSRSGPPGAADGQEGAVNNMHEAERSLFELRRHRAVYVESAQGPDGTAGVDLLVASAEGIDDGVLAMLREYSAGPLHLLITPYRARAMGIEAGSAPLALELPQRMGPSEILRLSSTPRPMPSVKLASRPLTDAEEVSLSLARLGHLLPAVVSATVPPDVPTGLGQRLASGQVLRAHASRIRAAFATPRLSVTRVSAAAVPLQDTEDAEFILFREEHGFLEHVAILIGSRERWPDPLPVRLHSACLTGDLFGSLKCDCGEQLHGSLRHFRERGGGVLLYLQQEGRGIGLGNKLRAYALQEGGLDTVDADCALGFGPDERSYDAAVDMLRHLGIERVQLLTNNPEKLRALESAGVKVLDRMPLHGTLNRHNLPYVKAKVQRAGHWLGDMLSEASERP